MIVDVHHHLFPPPFVAQLVEHEHYLARGVARTWTPRVSLDDMDQAGVATAITSITAPGFALLGRDRLVAVNRDCNDYGARMSADHRGRFGLFASLPLPDVDASLKEIGYALDTLKAQGVGLLTSYGDKWLGDRTFAPVLDELDRRGALVYVHPTAPDCCRNLLPGIADWVIEFPVDTTRTIASLLFSGTAARCKRIRFIFAHVGGILPHIIEHLVRAAERDVRSELRNFYYDTALRAHKVGMSSALEVIGVERLLFGSDAPLRTSQSQVDGLRACGLSAADLRKIEFENARRLLA